MLVERIEHPLPFFACPDFSNVLDPLIERIQMVWDALLDLLGSCFGIDNGYDDELPPDEKIEDNHPEKLTERHILPLRDLCIEAAFIKPLVHPIPLPKKLAEYTLSLSLLEGLSTQRDLDILFESAEILRLPDDAIDPDHLDQTLSQCKNLKMISFEEIETADQYVWLLHFLLPKLKDYPDLQLALNLKEYPEESVVDFVKIMELVPLDTCVTFFKKIKNDPQSICELFFFFESHRNDERWRAITEELEPSHCQRFGCDLCMFLPLDIIHHLSSINKISVIIENVHITYLKDLYFRINSNEWTETVGEIPPESLIRSILFRLFEKSKNPQQDVLALYETSLPSFHPIFWEFFPTMNRVSVVELNHK